MRYVVGDRVVTKKKHVCGSDTWEVIRMGAEIKLRCTKCGREIMVFKAEFDRKIKAILPQENSTPNP